MANQDELNESLQRLISLIESSDDAIIGKDLNGTIISWNSGATLSYGYSPAEAVGKSISIIIPPEGRAEFLDILKRIKRGEKIKHYETVRVRKDGTTLEVSLTVSPIIDKKGEIIGASSIARDITEQKRANDALREREKRYRMLVENAAEAILVIQDEIIRMANPMAVTITGFSEQELLSKPFPALIHPDDRAMAKELHLKRLKGEAHVRYEFRMIDKDESTKRIEIGGVLIEWDGRPATLNFLTDITERKRTDEALLEVQEKYRSLYNSLLELVYVHDFEGNFLDANPSALELLGYSAEELMSLSFSSLLDPVQLPTALETANELKTTGRQKRFTQFRLRKKNGEYLEVETIGSVIYDHGRPYAIQGIGRDITERRRANDALQESETRYRMLMESAGESIVVVQDGMIKMVNAMGTVISGYSQQELVSKPFKQLVHPDDRALVGDRHQRRLRGEAVPSGYDFRVLAKDGSTKWVQIRAVKIEWKGRPATLNILADITERKYAEMELKTKTAEALESSQRARSYFDFLAHDIANLLSPILGYAELISLDTEASESIKKKAGKIVNQAHRASSFILSLRRLDDAELMSRERIESKDLGTILDEAVTRVKDEYGDKRISATIVHPNEPIKFKGGNHLESIIIGILENSVAVADLDDIALEVKSTIVEENGHKFLRLELADDGPGISDDLKGCFMVSKDPRKQFETGISRGVASTLLISSAIVKSLGGELWVEDRITGDCSKGSRIVIKFPQEGFFGT